MNRKPILPVKAPASEIPLRKICGPFRFQFVIPGPGVEMFEDPNGNVWLQAAGGASVMDLVAGDNIDIQRTEDGKIVISAVDTAVDIAAGQNITIDIDPETGTAIINSIVGGPVSEHYKGVFDTPEDLIAFDTNPEQGDYGMIKQLVFSDGGDITWNGQYKYCFYINGVWKVVDQMLTFTDDVDLLQQFYSVGGSSPIIYLHEIARTGDFRSLRNVPIVSTPVATVEGNTITVVCATEGAEIWYSADGSMPHVNGTKYTGPITATGATTYRFVGIKNGMINSEEAVVSADYSLEAPTIDLDWHDGTVSMTNPNAAGTIYYTTDGTEPTDQSTAYTDPFIITEATTFELVVIDSGTASPVTVQRYEKAQNVSRFNALNNMIIGVSAFDFTVPENGEARYEMYDTVPTYDSPSSVGRIEFPFYDDTDNPRWYSVRVFMPGYVPSDVLKSLSVGMKKPTAPAITYNAETGLVTIGRVGETQSIQFSTTPRSNNCVIRYTLDGSEPNANSMVYSEPFQISSNVTVKAVLIAYAEHYSDVTTKDISLLAPPTAEIDYLTGKVTIINPNPGAYSVYTTDGTDPAEIAGGSTHAYSYPFTITSKTTVKMRAVLYEGSRYNPVASSSVSEQTFEQAQAPRISFRGTNGNYADFSTGIYKVLMVNPNSRGFITYTTDGTDPDDESTGYHTDFDAQYFDGEVTYKARIFHVGMVPSAVTTAVNGADSVDGPTFLFNDGKITIALTGNTTDVPLQTNLNVPEMGARIYYTTDGTTPTSQNGTLYTGPFTLPAGVTQIKAITELYSQYTSDVSVYGYLYFEALQANSEIGVASSLPTAPNLEYSRDGATWQEWRHTTADNTHAFDIITLENVGDRLYVRGTNSKLSDMVNDKYTIINGSGSFKSAGSVQSLVTADGNSTTAIEMSRLFYGFAALTSAPLFPATTLVHDCYRETLANCSSLTSLPSGFVLPASNLETYCYYGMFRGCTSLQSLPDNFTLASTNIRNGCYAYMFYGCESLTSLPDNFTLPATSMKTGCYSQMFMNCTSLISLPDSFTLPATTLETGCYKNMFSGCRFLMSDDASVFNFAFGATLPQTIGGITYSTPHDIAAWMGNPCGFDYMVPESALADDVVAVVLKDNESGVLKYTPVAQYDANKYFADQYTFKPFVRFTRGKNGRPVFMHKDQTGGMWAEFNRYRLACDTSAPGGFDWAVTINGAAKSGSVSWQAGDTLDSILAQLTPYGVNTYLVFSHVEGEQFIRITQGGYSDSTFTLSNNTGATLTDLSFCTKIGDVQQTETHRTWQAMNVDAMFPSLGFLAANTVQYAVNGYNLSYMCGGNETRYKDYYRTNGASSYLAENAVSNRMSEAAFNAMDGSGNVDAQALYDKYDGSWDAYMEASMVAIDDANANGIEYQSYDNGDTQTMALASVTTMDFDGSYIPAYPCATNCQSITDTDVANGKFNMNTEHELVVFMRDAKLDAINAAFDVLIAAGMTVTKLSRTAYYYWSVARYGSYGAWFYGATNGRLDYNYLYYGLAARPLAYPVNS